MTFRGLDKRKFGWMLTVGTEDSELRRFFNDCRAQLILKGARVQNLPVGKVARVKMLAQGLPSQTDPIVQRWFAKNLELDDPESVTSIIEMLRLYEDENEPLPDDMAKRYARSCLVHLVAECPTEELLAFMRPTVSEASEPAVVDAPTVPEATNPSLEPLDLEGLSSAIMSLVDGRDPDPFLGALPPKVATTISCAHAIRSGLDDEVKNALAALSEDPKVQAVFEAARKRRASASKSRSNDGLKISRLTRVDASVVLNVQEDEIFGVCTKDYPESAVFIRPYAVRRSNGALFSLYEPEDRARLLPDNGDVMAFAGPKYPRQPTKWEVGLWKIRENPAHKPGRSNFHIASDRTAVYEVVRVDFSSLQYDSLREYIKQTVRGFDKVVARDLLLLLSDGLIVGFPAGKDLSRDDGFDAGLPAWRSLSAFEFEGRILVPGPLPQHETYECEPLSMSVRKLAASLKNTPNRPTHAQLKQLQDAIASGDVRLNAARAARLSEELRFIEQNDDVVEAIVDQLRQEPIVSARIDRIVEAEAASQVQQKDALLKEIAKLEQNRADLKEKIAAIGKEHRAIAPGVSKAIRAAFEAAQVDGPKTLAQATVLKVLMDSVAPSGSVSVPSGGEVPPTARLKEESIGASGGSIQSVLRKLGAGAKAAEALAMVSQVAAKAGLILVIEGAASRIATAAWASTAGVSTAYNCQIGLIDDSQMRGLGMAAWGALCVLDANLSPIDLYARSMLDFVQRRLAFGDGQGTLAAFMSLSDGEAALALPRAVRSVSLKVSLDVRMDFLTVDAAEMRLDEITDRSAEACWSNELWGPALEQVIGVLRGMPPEEMALAISCLEASSIRFTL